MAVYQQQLSYSGENFTQVFQAGDISVSAEFQWAVVTQEIYDAMQDQLELRKQSLPLYEKESKQIVGDYDYLDYWLSVPSNVQDIIEWLQESPIIPFYRESLPEITIAANVLREVTFATSVNALLDDYEEELYWQVTLSLEDEIITTALHPGGITFFTNNVAVGFFSSRTSIGKNDLPYVTLQIGVPE